MMRHRRQAFTLSEVMSMLPLMAAALVIAFQISGQALRVQGWEGRRLSDDAVMSDLVRRIQSDAAGAISADVREQEGVVVLELLGKEGRVTYEAIGRRVRRAEQGGDGVWTHYDRTLEFGHVDFVVEKVGSRREVIWISFATMTPQDWGPMRERRWAAAATVGRGGVL